MTTIRIHAPELTARRMFYALRLAVTEPLARTYGEADAYIYLNPLRLCYGDKTVLLTEEVLPWVLLANRVKPAKLKDYTLDLAISDRDIRSNEEFTKQLQRQCLAWVHNRPHITPAMLWALSSGRYCLFGPKAIGAPEALQFSNREEYNRLLVRASVNDEELYNHQRAFVSALSAEGASWVGYYRNLDSLV